MKYFKKPTLTLPRYLSLTVNKVAWRCLASRAARWQAVCWFPSGLVRPRCPQLGQITLQTPPPTNRNAAVLWLQNIFPHNSSGIFFVILRNTSHQTIAIITLQHAVGFKIGERKPCSKLEKYSSYLLH